MSSYDKNITIQMLEIVSVFKDPKIKHCPQEIHGTDHYLCLGVASKINGVGNSEALTAFLLWPTFHEQIYSILILYQKNFYDLACSIE